MSFRFDGILRLQEKKKQKKARYFMSCLYHYCSNEKFYSILQEKNIRMGDICKSNDSRELQLFYPDLLTTILRKYQEAPFPFLLGNLTDYDAVKELVRSSDKIWLARFGSGDFSNFVVCFSKVKDSLSQWRGYADDGRGGCIGFSLEALRDYCDASDGVLRLEKVEYTDERQIRDTITYYAELALSKLKDLRRRVVDEITHDDYSPKTDDLISFNFDSLIAGIYMESLCLKSKAFEEEQEWRIFLNKDAYKNADLLYRKEDKSADSRNIDATLNFLNNRIDFRYTSDDLIPFCPLRFEEFPENPVVEVWLGPKNKARESDINLFLHKYGYYNVKVNYSGITYR